MDPINIAAIRHALGLSAQQLAAKVGVHQRSVQDWESGTRRISPANAHNLQHLIEHHAQIMNEALATAATGEPVPLPSDWPRSQRIALAAAVLAQNPTATFSETHHKPSP